MKPMNQRMKFYIGWRAALLCIGAAALLPFAVSAQTVGPDDSTPSVPRSIFKQPTNPKEGCDPFFPSSQRPYSSAPIATASTTDLSGLVLQGISGTSDHRLVIINDVTFAVGDEAEVVTPQGRIRIHCLEIVGDSAVIESNGQRQQLRYGFKP
jgi:hypothetical protein